MTNSRSHDNLVMFAIEYMTQQADPDVNIDNPEYHAAVLKELYELHKLRDREINSAVWDGLIEYQDGMSTVMHYNFPMFLQM